MRLSHGSSLLHTIGRHSAKGKSGQKSSFYPQKKRGAEDFCDLEFGFEYEHFKELELLMENFDFGFEHLTPRPIKGRAFRFGMST